MGGSYKNTELEHLYVWQGSAGPELRKGLEFSGEIFGRILCQCDSSLVLFFRLRAAFYGGSESGVIFFLDKLEHFESVTKPITINRLPRISNIPILTCPSPVILKLCK